MFGVCMTLTVIGVSTLSAPREILLRSDWMLGVTLVVGFGALAVLCLRTACDARPRLVIDDIGIEDRTLGLGKIPWSAIAGARPAAQRNLPVLCLELRDEAIWFARLSGPRRLFAKRQERLGLTPFLVNLLGTRISPALLAELVMVRVASTAGTIQSTGR